MSNNLNIDNLQKAFALATRASESENYDLRARTVFQAIAHELWLAAGRPADEEVASE